MRTLPSATDNATQTLKSVCVLIIRNKVLNSLENFSKPCRLPFTELGFAFKSLNTYYSS